MRHYEEKGIHIEYVEESLNNLRNSDYLKESVDDMSDWSYTTESFNINTKLFHGSSSFYDYLLPTGIDFGNTFQKPGWSLFTWTKLDLAVGWGVFSVLKDLKSYDNELQKLIVGCELSYIPIIRYSTYELLKTKLMTYPKDLLTFYVYTISPKKDYKYGLGHSSNTPNCITIRTNDSIIYDKVDEYILNIDLIDKYCKVVKDDTKVTPVDMGKNYRFMKFFMKYDYMYNHKIRKIIKKGFESGELTVGDDILEFIKRHDISLHKVGIKERLIDMLKKESVEENNDWSYIMETEESIEFFELEEFLEATGGNAILRDSIYPYIEKTFYSNPTNVRKFNSLVGSFIDRNIDKLTTSGPVYLIPFTDNDKKNYYDLFGIEETYIKKIMKEHTAKLNASKFKLLNQNPIFALFYFVIRYFTLHPDKKSLNSALTIYALSAYPSIFTKYFPNGVIEPVMQYTIDNLTDKFLIKKTGHILGLLVESIQHSYTFLKSSMKEAVDVEVIRFIQRIRNDHNSMFKKIMNIYMDNYKNNRGVVLTNTNYDDDTPIIDEVDNATTEVSNAINKVLLPIVQNGVDLVRAEASAKMAGISVSDCRMFLNNIINDKNTDLMQKFIESLLFLYIYEDHKTIRDVRSQYFLRWAASLFKKTNSKNKNINNINEVLNIWAENSGIYAKFHREASRINYKKAIFFYIVLSIQKYIG